LIFFWNSNLINSSITISNSFNTQSLQFLETYNKNSVSADTKEIIILNNINKSYVNESLNPPVKSFLNNNKNPITETKSEVINNNINKNIQVQISKYTNTNTNNIITNKQPQIQSEEEAAAAKEPNAISNTSPANPAATTETTEKDSSFIAFLKTILSGFSVIILAEIGDKTFFLVMIFSATNSFWSTLLVASTVMLTWNLVCLLIGSAIPVLLFKGFLDFVGMLIFLFFGISMIYSAYHMEHELIHKGLNETKSQLSRHSLSLIANANKPPNAADAAAAKDMRKSLSENNLNEPLLYLKNKNYRYEELENNSYSANEENNTNVNSNNNNNKENYVHKNLSNEVKNKEENETAYFFENEENYEDEEFGFHSNWAFASSLAIAEFGDKTQISSIVMGSTQNFAAVLIGTSLARIGGILIAVMFGKLIAHNVTHKQVTYIGGGIFIFFAFVYMVKFFN